MNKNTLQSCLALGLVIMSHSGFAAVNQNRVTISATVEPSVYYCSNTTSFVNSNCPAGNASGLLPSTAPLSTTAVDALNQQNPGTVGAILGSNDPVMGSTDPLILWSYSEGSGAPISGLAMSNSAVLAGQETGKTIAVNAYYVPCGTTPNSDGHISGAPAGAALSTTPTTIASPTKSCSQGGNIYFTLNPSGAENADGFVTPDNYQGNIDITMQALSG